MKFTDLSKDIIHYTCRYLKKNDIFRLAMVCRNINRKVKKYYNMNFYFNINVMNLYKVTGIKIKNNRYFSVNNINKCIVKNNDYLNYDLSNISQLIYAPDYKKVINDMDLSRLTHLIFDSNFNEPIDNLNLINLTHLTFVRFFNKPI